MNKLYPTFIILLLSILSYSQIPVGQWRSHIPNKKGLSLCEVEDKIYCLTETGIFYYNKTDNSIQKIDKINGLSGINTRSIAYYKPTKTVYIGYENGSIDLIKNNNQITTLNDIFRKSYASKTINKIQVINDLIYFSTNFGIVVYDPNKLEFKDTYIIGDDGYEIRINSIASDNNYLYAATENGIRKAPKNSYQLPNYATWIRIDYIPHSNKEFNAITLFKGKLIVSFKNEIEYAYKTYIINETNTSYETLSYNNISENYTQELKIINDKLFIIHKNHISIYDDLNQPTEFYNNTVVSWGNININTFDAIVDKDNILWYADNVWGLVKSNYNTQKGECKFPNGPTNNNAYYLDSKENETWVAAGALDISGANTQTPAAISKFKEGYWTTYDKENVDSLVDIIDLISIDVNPNNPNQIFCSSWNYGIIEMNYKEDKVISSSIYNEKNSTLKEFASGKVKVWDCKVDNNNNLWAINPGTSTPINVKTSNGKWYAYKTPSYNSSWGNFIITSDGSKWFLLPRGNGLFVFNDYSILNNTSNHFQKHISITDKNNNVFSNDVYAIAQDKNDQIWVGTNNGIVVYYSPYNIYNNTSNFYANKVIIDINGKNEYLMEGKKVTALAIDGANRKWIGTNKSGIFLMSEDGMKQILTFNTKNSPLPSDKINSISIDNTSGEIFIATGSGLMSYRGEASEGNDFFTDVYTFPNPVKPDYNGPITIKGLIENTTVKITDIAGNLVTEMNSLGGQAIWDGKNLNGNRVKTGIYLVFLSDQTGEQTEITKILFIN